MATEFKDIKDLSATELKKKKETLSEELFLAKTKNALGQLANPIQIRGLRRDLARVSTALTQKVVR